MEHFTPDRTAAGRRYDRTLGKLLPSSRLLSVLFCLLLNSLVYWCTQSMVAGRQLLDLTTSIDQMIPFDPRWVFIYVACFLFWAVGYVLMARLDRWYSIMTAEVLAKLICGIVFLLIPCTNVRPEIAGTGPHNGCWGLFTVWIRPWTCFPRFTVWKAGSVFGESSVGAVFRYGTRSFPLFLRSLSVSPRCLPVSMCWQM